MNKETEISTKGIAELFGVNKVTFSGCVDYIVGFPEPIRREANRRIYSLIAVKNWAEEKDVATIIRQASATKQKERYKELKENNDRTQKSIDSLRRMFFTGQFKKT